MRRALRCCMLLDLLPDVALGPGCWQEIIAGCASSFGSAMPLRSPLQVLELASAGTYLVVAAPCSSGRRGSVGVRWDGVCAQLRRDSEQEDGAGEAVERGGGWMDGEKRRGEESMVM